MFLNEWFDHDIIWICSTPLTPLHVQSMSNWYTLEVSKESSLEKNSFLEQVPEKQTSPSGNWLCCFISCGNPLALRPGNSDMVRWSHQRHIIYHQLILYEANVTIGLPSRTGHPSVLRKRIIGQGVLEIPLLTKCHNISEATYILKRGWDFQCVGVISARDKSCLPGPVCSIFQGFEIAFCCWDDRSGGEVYLLEFCGSF